MAEPALSIEIEEVSNPYDIARPQDERHRRNSDWLQTHWADVLPQARGKFLAVAGQEPSIADTPDAAWAWVATTHPEDDGALVQYIRPEIGPHIYAGKR
jgi:glutathione S-transferase